MKSSISSESSNQNLQKLLPDEFRKLGPGELLVNELFYSIQGESSFAGQPCYFIRLAGCHLRCSYCDTEYAFFEGYRETVACCIQKAKECGCSLVEVTGGEPLLQSEVHKLLTGLCDEGFQVLLETAGAIEFQDVDPRVYKIVDVKCPSSGMASRNIPDISDKLGPKDELKFVIGDKRDFEWAHSWLKNEGKDIPEKIPIHFSPTQGRCTPEELGGWILEQKLPVRLNLQIHKIIWPDKSRGA